MSVVACDVTDDVTLQCLDNRSDTTVTVTNITKHDARTGSRICCL